MKFIFPCKAYEQKAIEYVKEFHDHESEPYGCGGLERYLKNETYSAWLEKVIHDMDVANMPEGRVPALTYFYVCEAEDKIVGMINIRLALNDFLRNEGGHIGYCIRPAERGKGYGTSMLRDALTFCKTIGLCDILIFCDKHNIASAKVAKNCGGVLEQEFYSEVFKTDVQKYRVRSDDKYRK